ncbi:MAG: hypothetical protein EA352_02410 [Gemmatimonadales bacterium]|nr:MAG: hypothetical protein EA352_02410 [Gemmatimonadales bacterium]
MNILPAASRSPRLPRPGSRSPQGLRSPSVPAFLRLLPFLAVLLVWGMAPGAGTLVGQEPPEVGDLPADSAGVMEEVREMQAAFEAWRESRIPVRTRDMRGFRCDERIGRMCHWFGGADEADFPPEPVETGMARVELIGALANARTQVAHPWVLGQLVVYLEEDGRRGQALQAARQCELAETWWCAALEGYVLHRDGRYVDAEEAFERALASAPDHEKSRWLEPRFILTPSARSEWDRVDEAERERLRERLWRFSNPLFIRDGNDRWTEHLARVVLVMVREDAAQPYQIPWEEDLEESLIRYGWEIGWSRVRSAQTGQLLQDTRSIVGHHHPGSRGYLFPETFVAAPADIPPEAWLTGPREARTWYAARYAPDFRGLETQVARFRRGDSLLVVGAYRPDPGSAVVDLPGAAPDRGDPFGSTDPFGAPPAGGEDEVAGPYRSGLFLVPEDGGEILSVEGDQDDAVFSLMAPGGRWVSSLEVLDEDGGAAWRARQGIEQRPLLRGQAGLSDLVLLREDAPVPDSFEEAVPLVRPGIRVGRGERFVVAWEVYGLGVEDDAEVTLAFTRGAPGFLERVGAFLGLVETDEPLSITFREVGPDEVDTVFRALEISLPQLEPDEYTLHLELSLPGQEPLVSSRPIVVEDR